MPEFIRRMRYSATAWQVCHASHYLVDFQDGSCVGAILLPVSYFMKPLCSEGQHLSANQISSTYLNPRLRYNYCRFGKITVRRIGILLPVSYLMMSLSSEGQHLSATKFHRHTLIHGWDITTSGLEKQSSARLAFYFRFRIWWRRSLQKVRFYQQTKFRIITQSAAEI